MAYDLKIEIFAYKWFHRILLSTELLSRKYDVTEVYKDECLTYPECNEASDCDNLYYAIMFRRLLFEKLYLEEIETQINEFRHSQTDFYCYVLRTCNRVDLFSNLTIFERVFATCAFVCCLCLYCCQNDYSEIIRYGHICWAMFFDQFADEFYKQGGWNRLKMVAVSYKLPLDFVDIVQVEEREAITLIKIKKAIKSYRRFKKIGEIDHDECISMSWVKFYTQHINGSSDNEFFEEFHSNELKNYTEVENILKQLKYLCDPNGSEIVKSLGRMSINDSLETSMANLNICDKYVNFESNEESILASELEQDTTSLNLASKSSKKLNAVEENALACREPYKVAPTSLKISSKRNSLVETKGVLKDEHTKSEYFQLKSQEQGRKTATVEHLFENLTISKWKRKKDVKKNTILTAQLHSTEKKEDSNKIRYDSKEEQHEWKIIKDANKNTILNEQMSSTEDNAEKKNNKTQNDISNEQDEWKVEGTKRSTSLSGWITSTRRNAAKRSSDEAQNEQDKRKSGTKTTIPTEEKNAEMKNSNEIRDDERNEQDECKIIKRKTLTTKISFSKKRVKKENGNKHQDDIRKEQDELKDIKGEKDNAILTGQMSSTGKNAEEENKSRNSIRKEQEDGDVKNFLRMLLVLGDKQGISYVKKTS